MNIGNNAEISIRDLVYRIASLMSADVTLLEDSSRIRPAESEVERLCCDNSRAKALTGWRPEWSLSQGLEATIHWVQSNHTVYKAHLYAV